MISALMATGEEYALPAIQPSYLCEKELFITSSSTQMAIMQAFLRFQHTE